MVVFSWGKMLCSYKTNKAAYTWLLNDQYIMIGLGTVAQTCNAAVEKLRQLRGLLRASGQCELYSELQGSLN